MSSSKLLAGILVGAAAGALAGVLLAPESGKSTRQKLKKKGGDLGNTVKNKFNEFGESLSERYDNIKGEAKDKLGQAEQKFNEGKAKANELKGEAKASFS